LGDFNGPAICLIESPAYILLQAADRFEHPTRARNELWQTDFTYLPVVGWGWYFLSTVLDDYSRKILAWKLSATMRVEDALGRRMRNPQV
jgi:transposase InsO family protein